MATDDGRTVAVRLTPEEAAYVYNVISLRGHDVRRDPAESETFSSTGRYDVGPAEPEDDDAEVTS